MSNTNTTADKSNFVSIHLFNLLHAANEKVSDIAYVEASEEYQYVEITMENGCRYRINVTADSIMAIAHDVINFMLFR